MPIQIPSRTAEQSDDLINGIFVNALYPYSFRIQKAITAGNFPTVDGSNGQYIQYIWMPVVSVAVKLIESNAIVSGASGLVAIQVSANTTMTLADSSSLTIPADEANILHKVLYNNTLIQVSDNYVHANYYLQAGVPIYVSFYATAALIGGAGTFFGNVTIHTIPTGLRV